MSVRLNNWVRLLMPKSDFARHVVTLMTGTTIAQAIPVAISPILTRIYTPEDFGVLALFIAITAILGSVANARYELAIMLPEDDEDALNITALGFLISTSLAVIVLLLVVTLNEQLRAVLGNEEIGAWLYLAPLAIWLIGCFNALNYYNSRLKEYRAIASANVQKAAAATAVQLAIGWIKSGAAGLILGQMISHLTANWKLARNTLGQRGAWRTISLSRMRTLARAYQDFPKFSLWAVLANALSVQLTNILVSIFYSAATLGLYSLVQRVLGMPASLLGTAIGQVFYQHASEEKRKHGTAVRAFKSSLKKLLAIGVPLFIALFFLVEPAFAFVFGEEWRTAGEYAQILIPLYCIRFIVAPLTTLNQVNLRNRLGMLWQLGLLILSVSILSLSTSYGAGFKLFLCFYVGALSLYYVIFLGVIYQHTRLVEFNG